MSVTLVWIGIWSTTAFLIGALRGDLLKHTASKVLLLPGVLLDVGAQVIASVLSATPIKRVSIFGQGKLPIELGKSKLGPLGSCLAVTTKGIVLLSVTVFVLASRPEFLESAFALPLIDQETITTGELNWGSAGTFLEGLRFLPTQLGLGTLAGALTLYTLLAALLVGGLQRPEWLAWLGTWTLLFAVCWAGQWLGVTFGFLSRGWFIKVLYVPMIWSSFSLIVCLTLLLAIGVAVTRGTRAALTIGHSPSQGRS